MKDKIELIVEVCDEAFEETEPAACLIAQRLGIAEGDTCAAIFGCDMATYERCLAEAKQHAREDSSYAEKIKNVQLKIQARMIDDASTANCGQPASCESSTDRWAHVQAWLQEAGLVIDYLVSRTIEKRIGSFPAKTSPLFMQTADADGELTEELIVNYFVEMARLAKDGFTTSEEFPVFGGI